MAEKAKAKAMSEDQGTGPALGPNGEPLEGEAILEPDAVKEAGYQGIKVDPTPNEEYTVAGQVGGTAKAPKGATGGNS